MELIQPSQGVFARYEVGLYGGIEVEGDFQCHVGKGRWGPVHCAKNGLLVEKRQREVGREVGSGRGGHFGQNHVGGRTHVGAQAG